MVGVSQRRGYHSYRADLNSPYRFTFPLGVFSVCTTQLSIELESTAFKVLGTIFSLCVVALWIGVVIMTGAQAWSGVL
jgi:tellurite resistance protein TehA-like permease